MQFLDLGAHGDAQLGIEVGERFVEKEDLRIAHDRPAHGDALALAAGELARIAVEKLGEAENLGSRARRAGRCPAFGEPFSISEKAMLSRHRHMRIKRIVLEHHGDIALAWAAAR